MKDNKNSTWIKDINAKTGNGNGLRFNKGKLRYDLVHPRAHEDMVKVLTYGAEKYTVLDDEGNVVNNGANNWRNGFSWKSVIASLKRHVSAIELGEDYDDDTGMLHIAHAACNVHFLNAFYYDFPQGDDRFKKFLKTPKIGLDIDGILADFTGAWNKLYPEISATPNSWYFDRNIKKRFDKMREEGTLNTFYMNIEPIIQPSDIPFIPHCYITSRPIPKEITEDWLDMYNFPRRPVYSIDIRQSKIEAAKESGIEIFVDDSYDNFVDLNNNGIFTYLYTAPWNTRHNVGHMRLNTLMEIPLLK